jgi:hypothetical protein
MGRRSSCSYQPLSLDDDIVDIENDSIQSQSILIDGEIDAKLEGYSTSKLKTTLFILLNLLTFGLAYILLISTGNSKFLLKLTCKLTSLSSANKILITTKLNEKEGENIQVIVQIQSSHFPGLFTLVQNKPPPLLHQDSKTSLLNGNDQFGHRYFIHRNHKWIWNQEHGNFIQLVGLPSNLTTTQLLTLCDGVGHKREQL